MSILIAYLLGILTAIQGKDKSRSGVEQHARNDSDHSFPDRPISVVCVPPTLSNQDRANKEKQDRRKSLKFWVQVVSLIILAVYAGFTIAIWWKMKEANKISRDNFVSAQRAFVSFSPNVQPFYATTKGSPKLAWEFQVPMRNSGTTPTDQLQDHIFIKVLPNILPDSFNFQDFEEGRRSTIAPQDHISYVTDTVSSEDMSNIKAGNKYLYIYGWARYHDKFAGTPIHITEFCYQMHATEGDFTNTKGPWITRTTLCSDRHNCTDDECKAEK
jgi:hypothetical protein